MAASGGSSARLKRAAYQFRAALAAQKAFYSAAEGWHRSKDSVFNTASDEHKLMNSKGVHDLQS